MTDKQNQQFEGFLLGADTVNMVKRLFMFGLSIGRGEAFDELHPEIERLRAELAAKQEIAIHPFDEIERLKEELEKLKAEYSLTPFGVTELLALRESNARLIADVERLTKLNELEDGFIAEIKKVNTELKAEVERLKNEGGENR